MALLVLMQDAPPPAAALPAALPPAASPPTRVAAAPAAPAADGSFSFHELLSELNPLQYIPVVGTIYRSVTGDVIPETARTVGSLVFSGLTGGPIGLAASLALLGLERALGMDREKMGQQVLASLGIGDGAAQPAAAPGAQTLEAGAPGPAGEAEPSPAVPTALAAIQPAEPWSPAQLRAYGISTNAAGTLVRGSVAGSDVLNDLVVAGFAGRGGRPGAPGAPATVMTA